MSQAVATAGMTGEQMVALCRQHSLYEWSAQGAVDPIPVARAKGIYFWTPEDKRYIDFNSQLMCVNAGHGHPAIIKAIQDQAATLAYTNPFMASEARARLGAKLAEITPGDMDVFFFTNGGAEGNENAIRIARVVTGRHKILARYRSYHGGTAGSLTLTGDPRRWAAEPGIPGVVRVLDPYHGMARGWDTAEQSLRYLEEVIELEGPKHIAAFILETISGTNGILVPPDGYLQGVRALCDKHGILLICDEVMAGFGRTGKWFAVDHWNVVPDLMTMAKGLTSAYVPLGAVGMRRTDRRSLRGEGLLRRAHLQQPSARLRRGAGHHQGLRRGGDDRERPHDGRGDGRRCTRIWRPGTRRSARCATSACSASSSSSATARRWSRWRRCTAARRRCRRSASSSAQEGLYTFVRWNTFFTNPPLCITEAELREAFAIIDKALDITDRAVVGA